MKLCVIRHAESLANAASDLDNPTYYYDAKITERGVMQAKKLHHKIKDLSFDKYFSFHLLLIALEDMLIKLLPHFPLPLTDLFYYFVYILKLIRYVV